MFQFEFFHTMAFLMTILFSIIFESKKQLDSFLFINFYLLVLYALFYNCFLENADGKTASQ